MSLAVRSGLGQSSLGQKGLGRQLASSAVLLPYDSDAKAYFDRMSVTPSTARQELLNNFVKDWKTAGLWDLTGALWLMAMHDAQAVRLNIKANKFNLTPVGSPLFTLDRGAAFDGASSYFKTGFVPGAADTLFQQNSAHLGVFIRSSEVGTYGDIGARISSTVGQSCLFAGLNGPIISPRINIGDTAPSSPNFPVVAPSGYTIGTRVLAANQRAHKNADDLGVNSLPSTAPSALEMFIGALNQNGAPALFSPRQYCVAHVGLGLSTAQRVSANIIVRNYLAAIGAASPP